jgi:DNA-binding LytR/AlgR family response regulator
MDEPKSDALRDMDVEIRLDATRRKPRFIIETAEMTPELTRLIQQLTARTAVPIIGYQQDKAFPLQQDSLVRVWAANGHVYAATETGEFLLRQRLWELEERLDSHHFIRISNSEIINLRRVIAFDLSLTGTICVILQGGQISYVSRRYVRTIRQALGL